MGKIGALLITFSAGLAFFLGALISALFKDKKKISEFSIAMAFAVMMGVIILDLIPETKELFGNMKTIYRLSTTIGFTLLGIILLKVFDIFIPNHDHNKVPKNKHERHLFHIGLITVVALIIHNIVEGVSIYSSYLADNKMGILLSLGVMLHNIPFGIQVTSNMAKDNVKTILALLLLSCSTIMGALAIFVLNTNISSYVLGSLISITLGMMIYIAIFELLEEFVINIKSKWSILGCLLGLVIVTLAKYI